MRRWEELNKEHANKGLRFFTAFSGGSSLESIEAKMKEMSLTLPVATDGYYNTRFIASSLCVVWVIGVDGKIVHVGQEGWEDAALKELKKIKYPGLGIEKVAVPMESAAKAFGEGKLALADKLAEAVLEGDFDQSVFDQADVLRKRVTERRKLLESRADTEEICGDFDLALACWKEINARFGENEFERSPKDETVRIGKLAELDKERKARRAFIDARQKCWVCFEKVGNNKTKIVTACDKAIVLMKEFVAANKDCRPVSHAQELIDYWSAWKEELEPKPAEK